MLCCWCRSFVEFRLLFFFARFPHLSFSSPLCIGDVQHQDNL